MSLLGQCARRGFTALVLSWVFTSQVAAQPRIEIVLFKYKGAVDGQKEGVKFENFRAILDDKLLNLKREVQSSNVKGRESGYFDKVHIKFRDRDNFVTSDDIHKWMRTQPEVLGLLRGSIISDDDKNYVVFSQFYLGDLKSYDLSDPVRVRLPVEVSEFANTKDTHTLVLLYALAMDAKRLRHDIHHIAELLNSAKNKLADIKRRNGALSGDLIPLERAIERVANEIVRK